ncbi:UBA domain-containing 3 [Hyphodiscus hymeniophilus]|uniref:UBA domain-containing 3 n=1 Tax=Hyphodiscus hymeniophilus TaxID=353542 RepID=A0A9P6VQ04_9HELO|nr:UBA domain-containing 3 [Hyphodiscus hymeniophilus]
MGTHITKVKSLSMDSWSSDQVEHMKRVGNVASNRIYNPQNTRPPIPFDADEADSAMERFIRQKYQERTERAPAPARHHTGSTNSDDQPPPLPPKPGSRFGFRSASSIFPLSSKSKRQAAATAQLEYEQQQQRARSPSPDRRSKPSKVFGTSVGSDDPHDLEMKLATLRDMGFRDEKRNTTVLKGLKGNLEKSIETLVRLGEGASTGGLAKPGSGPSSRSRTPVSASAGLTIDRTRGREQPKSSSNPFDALDSPRSPLPPQSSQSTGSMQPAQVGNNPFQQPQSSNPFGLNPSQSQYALNQSFQNMAVTPSQPLFPNHTGGFPAQQQSQLQLLYQQSMTPPVPSIPQQYHPPIIYENAGQQPQQNYNPFMQQQQQVPPINTSFQSNPYAQVLSAPAIQTRNFFNSPIDQSPMQHQGRQVFYDNGVQQQAQMQQQQQMPQTPQAQQSNPFFQNSQQQVTQQQMPQLTQQQALPQSYDFQGQQQAQFQQQRQQTFPLMPQQTGRADKRSILDLYNYPQLAPTPLHQQQDQSEIQNAPAPSDAQQQTNLPNPVPAPMAGSKNPFMYSGGSGVQRPAGDAGMGAYAPAQQGARHVSQESLSVDTGGWNGRHSPDAWGTISSRSVR